jgi:hypothetical protein
MLCADYFIILYNLYWSYWDDPRSCNHQQWHALLHAFLTNNCLEQSDGRASDPVFSASKPRVHIAYYFTAGKFVFYRALPVTTHLMQYSWHQIMCQYCFCFHTNIGLWGIWSGYYKHVIRFLFVILQETIRLNCYLDFVNLMHSNTGALIWPQTFIITRNLWRSCYFLQCHVPVTHYSGMIIISIQHAYWWVCWLM